jgi:hypothetical protein
MVNVLVLGAWAVPLAAAAAMCLGMGANWVSRRGVDSSRPPRLICQITTRGTGPAANEVAEILHSLPGRLPREVWVVVDEGSSVRFPLADRVIEVPAAFRCRVRAKGRALEWARRVREREGITGNEKVLLLDDDSAPTPRYLRYCEDVDADIAQGIVAPRRHYGRLISHLDDLRPLHCLAVCSWAQARGKPIHVHGEGLCIRASAEHAVGWDTEGSDLAEDLVFGQRASSRGLRWAFLPAVIENTSPWTAEALIAQRRRWTWGTLHALKHLPTRGQLRVVCLYLVTLGGFAISAAGTAATALQGEAPGGPWVPSLVAWLGLFGLSGLVSSNGNILQATIASLLSWLTSVVNALIVPLVLLLGPPDGFRTIEKLRPARKSRLAARVTGALPILLAIVPGLLGLGLMTAAAASGPAASTPPRWTSDDAGGLSLGDDRSRAPQLDSQRRRIRRARHPDLTRAISVIAYGNDPYFGHKADRLLGRLARLGITHVSLTVPIFTDGVRASEVHIDPDLTPDRQRIEAFAELAHRRGMSTGLNPLLDEESLAITNNWRGSLEPTDPEAWFRSYADLAAWFADVARRGRFQTYNIGTEFESLDEDPRWQSVLASVRSRFQGTVSYAMAGSRVSDPDPPLVAANVDQVGINAWYEASLADSSKGKDLRTAYAPWRAMIRRFAATLKAPIVFTEAGSPSQAGAYRLPTRVTPGVPADGSAQRATYGAICDLAHRVNSRGVLWWATTLDPPARPEEDTGFDPLGKPAQRVVRRCALGADRSKAEKP